MPWTRNEHSAVAGVKTTSYAENVRALAHAAERGCTEALFANTAGLLCEGTGTNVFVVHGGRPAHAVRSRRAASPASPASWCWRSPTRSRPTCRWRTSHTADEVFLTSTGRDVQAVARLDDRDLGPPGPVTAKAAEAFASVAAADADP